MYAVLTYLYKHLMKKEFCAVCIYIAVKLKGGL